MRLAQEAHVIPVMASSMRGLVTVAVIAQASS
jgi:hypothetical protein